MKKDDLKKKVLLAIPALTASIFSNVEAEGYATGYSDWSTIKTGNEGEVSRTEYRYADVKTWSPCDSSHTTKPDDEHYIEGKYDPKNCTWWSTGSCNAWSCNSWYISSWWTRDNCSWGCNPCGWWDTWSSSWINGTWGWFCNGQISTPNWSCNGWKCTGWAKVQHNDGSCGETATCYSVPEEWTSWSDWSTEEATTSTERKIETREVYSYPQDFYLTINTNIAGTGSFDVYVNGEKVASNVNTFSQKYSVGTKYKIDNIKIPDYYALNYSKHALSGKMGLEDTTITLNFEANNIYYDADCIVDESGNLVTKSDAIADTKDYDVVEKTFSIPESNNMSNDVLCVGKYISKSSDREHYNETLPATLLTGSVFNTKLKAALGSNTYDIKFTSLKAPTGVTTTDYSANQDGSVLGWVDGNTYYIATYSEYGIKKIEANTDSSYMFKEINCTSIDFENFDTSNVTIMRAMFYGCSSLTSLDITSFDTSSVTDMNTMFYNCSKLTELDLSNLDTSKVTDMTSMFNSCSKLTTLDLSNFDTSKVTTTKNMFKNASSLTTINLSSFNTSNVNTMLAMFDGCSGLTSLDLSSFNTTKVTTMGNMFYGCSCLTSLDLSSFDTSNVGYMYNMFFNDSGLTELNVSSFDTSNVTNMSSMFYGCSGLTELDLKDFTFKGTTNVATMLKNMGTCTVTVDNITDADELTNLGLTAGYKDYLTNNSSPATNVTINEVEIYTLLDYIQSTGTQYINTGINATTTIDAEVKVDAQSSTTSAILGSWSSSNGLLLGYSNGYAFAYGGSWGGKTGTYNTGYHILKKEGNNGYYDGTLVYTQTQNAYNYPIYIFSANTYGNATKSKIAYAKLWDNGELVRDYIPVKRASDGAIGLYDKVEGKFYANAGTGTFTAGSTIGSMKKDIYIYNDVYEVVNSLTTTGTQRITLTIPTAIDFEISSKFKYSGSSYPRLLKTGSYNVEIKSTSSFYTSTTWSPGITVAGVDSVVKKTGTAFSVTVGSTTKSTTYSATSSGTMYLFGETASGNGGAVTFYNMKIYKEGTTNLLFDLIPVKRVSDGVIGLYNKVNGSFFVNTGSGTFTAGSLIGTIDGLGKITLTED